MHRPILILAALALPLFWLAGCGGAAKAVEETVSLPVRAVGEGVEAVGKGVGEVGRAATEGVVGRILTDRNRHSLLREHRELGEHMKAVEAHLRDRGTLLPDGEQRVLQGAKDNLAAAGRQLEAERIPMELGLSVQGLLDKVRETFQLFRARHNTPPYTGFVALR